MEGDKGRLIFAMQYHTTMERRADMKAFEYPTRQVAFVSGMLIQEQPYTVGFAMSGTRDDTKGKKK